MDTKYSSKIFPAVLKFAHENDYEDIDLLGEWNGYIVFDLIKKY